MRVIVLGGTRFIGRAIVEDLLEHGHEPMLVHRGTVEPQGFEHLEHVHVDRNELSTVAARLTGFDGYIDTSAAFGVHATTALDALPDGLRMVVLSSMDVYRAYGSLHAGVVTEPVPMDETSPLRPERYPYRGQMPGMDDYEKQDVEEPYLARGATICRLPMVYGERDYQRREEFVLRRVRHGRTRIPVGPANWVASRGYVRDIAAGVRLALESPAAAGEVFNLCERRSSSTLLWMRAILAAAGHEAELVTVPEDRLPEDLGLTAAIAQHLIVDSSKARTRLGWTDTDPDEALRASVAWHLDNPPAGEDPGFDADENALASV